MLLGGAASLVLQPSLRGEAGARRRGQGAGPTGASGRRKGPVPRQAQRCRWFFHGTGCRGAAANGCTKGRRSGPAGTLLLVSGQCFWGLPLSSAVQSPVTPWGQRSASQRARVGWGAAAALSPRGVRGHVGTKRSLAPFPSDPAAGVTLRSAAPSSCLRAKLSSLVTLCSAPAAEARGLL